MRRFSFALVLGIALCTAVGFAQLATTGGPYKVLKAAKAGGEGGWDYIYADPVGRRLYIPRGAVQARQATATSPAAEAVDKRLTIWNLDTLDKVGEIAGVGGNGAAVCPKTGQVLPTMGNSRTIAFDSKTGHIFTMAQDFGPAPAPAAGAPAPGGRGAGRGPAVPGSFTILMIGKSTLG